MNKICDKLVVVVPDGLTDAQITSVDDYISSLPYIDPLVNRVLYVLQVGFDEIICVLGRDGKNIDFKGHIDMTSNELKHHAEVQERGWRYNCSVKYRIENLPNLLGSCITTF